MDLALFLPRGFASASCECKALRLIMVCPSSVSLFFALSDRRDAVPSLLAVDEPVDALGIVKVETTRGSLKK